MLAGVASQCWELRDLTTAGVNRRLTHNPVNAMGCCANYPNRGRADSPLAPGRMLCAVAPWRYYVRMLPVLWPVVVMYVVAYALAGMAIGVISGWVVSRMTKARRPGLVKDALLGLFGYVGGIISCALMPWPENTVVEQLPSGGSVATTMSRYQHPQRVAVVLAILFPLLLELYKWKKHKPASLT